MVQIKIVFDLEKEFFVFLYFPFIYINRVVVVV